MARYFDLASSQYLYAASAPVSTIPCTLACWFKLNSHSVTSPLNLMCINTAATDNEELSLRVAATTNYFQFNFRASDTNVGGSILTGTTTGAWTHGVATATDATTRAVYQNGSSASASLAAGSITPVGLDCMAIGANYRAATGSAYFDGAIAHAAVWSVALSASEVASLYNDGRGLDPRSVRPEALAGYWPLIGDDGDRDWWGNTDLTASGSPTYTDHPPVLMRSRPKFVFGSSVATAPTISSVTLSGTSQIGNTLTATVVTDQDPVDSTAYQWQKAAQSDAEPGTDLSGTASTLALTYADFADLLDSDPTNVYVRCQAIATKNALPSTEVPSAWQAVTVPSGSGSTPGSLIDSPLII